MKTEKEIIQEVIDRLEKEQPKTEYGAIVLALDLLVIMFSKNMIDETDFEILKDRVNKNDSVLEDIIEILFTTIEESEGKKIMNEYFGHDNH